MTYKYTMKLMIVKYFLKMRIFHILKRFLIENTSADSIYIVPEQEI